MPAEDRPILRLGHSPDPDDAFMWWPLFELGSPPRPPRINTGRFRFLPVTADIETLNQRSEVRDQRPDSNSLEISAISCAQYPYVQDRYALTSCGASMGEQYGPKLISRSKLSVNDLKRAEVTIAVPGVRTSAFATLSMVLGKNSFRYTVVPFEQIIDRVADGTYAAGLVIHEGQLAFEHHTGTPLHLIQDLGAWWWQRHQLPLPLGVNVIRRDLEQLHGPGTLREITFLLRQSVEYALAHREESIEYALQFARGIPTKTADEFIRMYVNKWTLDFGPTGCRAVAEFLTQGHQTGLIPMPAKLDFVEPAKEFIHHTP